MEFGLQLYVNEYQLQGHGRRAVYLMECNKYDI